MKQKILELLPRAGALFAALVVLISCVAVPARAASTSEGVKYYDIVDFDMTGTLTGGATAKETFDVADYMSLYGETYLYSSWKLLITGQFENVKLVSSYGATYYSDTVCSYQFTLSKDWFLDPSIKVQQENVGVTGRYRITGAYLINSTYTSRYLPYYEIVDVPVSNSYLYNNVYNFEVYNRTLDIPAQGVNTVVFSPQQIIPCTSMYFEFEIEGLQPDDFSLSVVALSSDRAVAEIYDYDLTLISTTAGYYHYAVEVMGPFTDFVFVIISYTASDHSSAFTFDGFYVGYNRILNTNSLLDQIREQVTQIRSYLSKMRTRLDEIASDLGDILDRIANGDLGSNSSTNIFDSWNSTITGLSGMFQSVVNAVKGISGDITSGLSSSINSISRAVDGIAASVTSGLSSSISSISKAVDGIAASVTSGLSSSINSISTAVEGIAGDVSYALASAFDSVTTAVEGIAGDIIAGMPDIVGAVSDIPLKVKDALTPDWQSSIFGKVDSNGIVDFFSSSYDSVFGLFGASDLITNPDSPFSWFSDGMNDPDSVTSDDLDFYTLEPVLLAPNFFSGLTGFWDFTTSIVEALPANVVSVFTLLFMGFLFIGILKIF